jgi:DNA invertase Pin-like site-specific DNA recombinase
MNMEMKRVGIYCRVSTKEQNTDNQLLDLRRYCEARSWQIVTEEMDAGISGTISDRPALNRIMGMVRQRKIDVLLVWRFDRLARSLSHLVGTMEELRTLGVNFCSYQEQVDTSTSTGALCFGIFAAIAQFERALIVERVHAGLRRAKSQGKLLGRPRATIDRTKAEGLAARGMSRVEIGSALGVSSATISRLLSPKPQPVAAL